MNARPLCTTSILRILAAVMVVALVSPTLLHAGEAKPDLAALVQTLPDCDRDGKYTGPALEVAQKAVQQVLDGGKDNIVALVRMLKDLETGDAYKAYYLLHAVSTHVVRPGADEERKMFCDALASTLAGSTPASVRGRVLEELKWIGRDESVAAIGKLLLDQDLYDPAVEALVNMKASAPMRKALPNAAGRNRVALIQALGVLRDAEAAPALIKEVGNADRDIRLAAMAALARIGAPDAVGPMLKAAAVESLYERSQVIDALLMLARKLTEDGQKKPAELICRHLLKTYTGKADSHIRCGAIIALAQAAGADAMDEVLAAMSSDDPSLRAAGLEAAITMPGEQATQSWVERMQGADPARRVAILGLLARRGDKAALPAILDAMKDADEKVRVAAITAAGPTGDERAVGPLTAALTSPSAAESMAAQNALLSIPGKPVTTAIAKSISGAAPAVKIALLTVVAGRNGKEELDAILACTRDENADVRAAAASALGKLAELKDLPLLAKLLVDAKDKPVRDAAESALAGACSRLGDKATCVATLASALAGAQGEARVAVYRVLAGIGNRAALDAVRAGLTDKDEAVQDAAIRGLADWPDDTPADDLLRIAKTTKNDTHHVLAVRGYVRMIGVRMNRPTNDTLTMCQAAMDAARRPDEKRLVLAALGKVPDLTALTMAQAQLKGDDVKTEAAMAVISIARGISGAHRDEARDAIKSALLAAGSDAVKQQAKQALDAIEQSEDFITGWMVSGPYKGGSTKPPHPPEKADAKDVKWKLVSATSDQPGVVDLNNVVGQYSDSTAYLKSQVWSPEDQKARLETGSDDGLKIWVNDEVVLDKDVPRSLNIGEDKTEVKLKKGWNTLLLKVTQGGGGWEACARIRAADGSKLQGIRLKAE